MQRAGVRGKRIIAVYIPLNWFNVNETNPRLKVLTLVCTEVLLPLPEMFRRVTRLGCDVKTDADLVKPG